MIQSVDFPIRNVSCEACEKVIGRILSKYSHARILSISPNAQTLSIECEEADVSSIREKLSVHNYLASDSISNVSHLGHVISHIIHNKSGYQAEHALLVQSFLLFSILLFALIGAKFFLFSSISQFSNLSPILFLIPLGITVCVASLLHVRNLSHHFSCQNGMMTGMIIGMVTGFMSGALVGATNGMFVGSLVGMVIGMSASAYAVRRTGIMGVLEGLMAGLMSGTMGAMLSVMMISDNLVLFLYILFFLCSLIILGMSYFIVKEVGPIQDEHKPVSFAALSLFSLLFFLALLGLIFFGPKSSIVWGSL